VSKRVRFTVMVPLEIYIDSDATDEITPEYVAREYRVDGSYQMSSSAGYGWLLKCENLRIKAVVAAYKKAKP
jgi:hypothetical protein